ncbi:MAG TPA: phage tail tape measure protein [Paracoccus sp. (in: a-proteobacteria)]|uniref:phage tail tape measure protein n=1 Tax=uncultured Paracoccus sp. TaxID=189685 RepID=UPI002614C717|nr:phage tail tape measure protein [uncultured Paracoccus sp.]HMQ42008.1 phage tail tape measure protein [Paracoccus sp. (in: a-proteobacteria)]HMR35441.1 phage tail tape measure protein [Paracoccus sp. (in: a-proteobacteria)]
MADRNGLDPYGDGLEQQLDKSADMAASFTAELGRMQQSIWLTGREVDSFASGIGGGLKRAFDGLIFDGMKLSDALKGIARSMADTAYNIAMKPIRDAVAGALAGGVDAAVSNLMPFADGAAFSQGRVSAFAKGGVVSQPTRFPMRGGTGLMGEAGPEAIMPLTRGADGRLGVAAAGGGRPVSVNITVNTPDVAGFARSQGQIAAQMGRMLARGQRNM